MPATISSSTVTEIKIIPQPPKKRRMDTSCPHVNKLKQDGGIRDYEKVLVLVANIPTELSKMKANLLVQKFSQLSSYGGLANSFWNQVLINFQFVKRLLMTRCLVCPQPVQGGQMFACLHCIFMGCQNANTQHMKAHSKEHLHPIACELAFGTVYCFECSEYIFEASFEGLRETIQNGKSRLGGNITHFPSILQAIKGEVKCVKKDSTIGLRGLINLGHTCFMSCIVQVIVHTPILTDFFLGERIDCSQDHDNKPCMITDMFDIFQQFYCGEKSPFALTNLLIKMWLNAPALANTDQQDAHEFLALILEAIGRHFKGMKIRCAIEGIFYGSLRSTVKCLVCGMKSMKTEDFLNISLEVFGDTDITLDQCLRQYTQVEHLGPSHTIDCKRCGTKQESSKQLEFTRFPLIFSVHFKRFMSTTAKKWEHLVQFPLQLNLSSFASEEQENLVNGHKKDWNLNNKIGQNYSLYGVLEHGGTSEGGHYIAYIRNTPGTWIKCDDVLLTKVSEAEVLNCKAYMLFYYPDEVPDVNYMNALPMQSLNIN